MKHTDYLPPNIGTYLSYNKDLGKHSTQDIQSLKGFDYVICIDGLAGSGKSTLGHYLSSSLNIPHISSGIFYRVFTYILETKKIEFSPSNIEKISSEIQFKVNGMDLVIYYKNIIIPLDKLRSKELDGALNRYSTDLFFRNTISKMLVFMVKSIKSSFILDLRGSSPEYVKLLEQEGRQVIRFLLVADLETKVKRRAIEYGKKLNKELSQEDVNKIRQDIVCRDTQDVASIIKTGIGLVEHSTGIIDSSNMNAFEVQNIALNFIHSSLRKIKKLQIKQ